MASWEPETHAPFPWRLLVVGGFIFGIAPLIVAWRLWSGA